VKYHDGVLLLACALHKDAEGLQKAWTPITILLKATKVASLLSGFLIDTIGLFC
jgi:hypothetical protein